MIQASNNKVKDKVKWVVPKSKKTGPIKDKMNVSHNANRGKQKKKDVTEAQEKTVIKEKEASKRKTKEVPRKEIKNKTKGEIRKKDEDELVYKVKKILDNRIFKKIWKIEVKWKDNVKTTWEPMKIITVDQPKIMKCYLNEFCKKNKVVTLQNKEKWKKRTKEKG